MSVSYTQSQLPVLVFTDLDGTLLDHHDYRFTAAEPALQRLRELQIPVIPTTSKTLAELEVLNKAIGCAHPCIVENGSALCVPKDYFDSLAGAVEEHGYQVLRMEQDYSSLLEILHRLREEQGFQFRGFSDMSAEDVAKDTGLSVADAARAKQRLCSEPFLWQDSPEALERFVSALAAQGLSLTRGGRYWHVMGKQSKAKAMERLQALYEDVAGRKFTTIALGDSPNDEEMLRAADRAVIVRRPDGSHLDFSDDTDTGRTMRSTAIGPAGWNEAMQRILDELVQGQRCNDPSHSCCG